MPRAPQPTAFQPLLDYLASYPTHEVTLTFREIAALIGRPLPEQAVLRPSWWHTQARRSVRLWQALGWRARADRDHLRVTFTRARAE